MRHTLRVLHTQLTRSKGKCQGVTIIPFNAGHTLGGTIWKIRSPTAGTILYAVDMNHMKERHLDGTVLMRQGTNAAVFETLVRPDLLITAAQVIASNSVRRHEQGTAGSLIGVLQTYGLSTGLGFAGTVEVYVMTAEGTLSRDTVAGCSWVLGSVCLHSS